MYPGSIPGLTHQKFKKEVGMENKKVELYFDEAEWTKHETQDILDFTEHMRKKDQYTKYPHTHRFGRAYRGEAPIVGNESYLKPEKGWGKYIIIMAVVVLLLAITGLCFGDDKFKASTINTPEGKILLYKAGYSEDTFIFDKDRNLVRHKTDDVITIDIDSISALPGKDLKVTFGGLSPWFSKNTYAIIFHPGITRKDEFELKKYDGVSWHDYDFSDSDPVSKESWDKIESLSEEIMGLLREKGR